MIPKEVYILLCFIGIMLGGCKQNLSPKDYIQWFDLNENLTLVKEIGDHSISVTYRNGTYNYVQSTLSTNEIVLDEAVSLASTHCFTVELSSRGQELELAQIVDGKLIYLMNDIQHDFTLFVDEIKVPCSLHHFERTFNLKKSISLIAVFDHPITSENDLVLQFEDRILKTGTHNFRFTTSAISDIPKLKI